MSAYVDPATALVHATPGSLQLDYLEKTNGVYLVGYMFSMVLYGFTFFQAYMYYSRYPKDTWGIKTFVALIVGIDTSVSVLLSQTLYYYMVTLFPFTRGVEVASTPFCAQLELSAIAVFLAQLFFAWNIWTNSKNAVMSGITAAFATAAFVFGTITSVKLLDDPIFAHLANNPNKSFAAIAQGLSAGAALAALFGLSFGSLPKGFKPFKSSFDSIVGYGICYGGLAAAIQLGYTFVFVGAPSRHYWFPFQVVATKLFVISAITFLNTRESLTPRASNKEDWSTQSGVTASRTFGGASHHVVSAGTVPGHHTPTEYGVKPIVINVDQSTEREIDEEFRVKREFEPYRG